MSPPPFSADSADAATARRSHRSICQMLSTRVLPEVNPRCSAATLADITGRASLTPAFLDTNGLVAAASTEVNGSSPSTLGAGNKDRILQAREHLAPPHGEDKRVDRLHSRPPCGFPCGVGGAVRTRDVAIHLVVDGLHVAQRRALYELQAAALVVRHTYGPQSRQPPSFLSAVTYHVSDSRLQTLCPPTPNLLFERLDDLGVLGEEVCLLDMLHRDRAHDGDHHCRVGPAPLVPVPHRARGAQGSNSEKLDIGAHTPPLVLPGLQGALEELMKIGRSPAGRMCLKEECTSTGNWSEMPS